jgi:hypothetical protein
MAIDPNDIYNRRTPQDGQVRREQDVDFKTLLYGMAEGIADAQLKLDYNTAESAALFSEIEVPVVPQVTRQIDSDGNVTTTYGDRETRTLFELGFEPTRYQFGEVTMDIKFDLKLHTDEEGETRLRTSTSEAHHNRKYQKDIDTTASLSATLLPVPTPAGLSPAEATATAPVVDAPDESDTPGTDDGT